MIYIDSNVFIFAVLFNDSRTERAQQILKNVTLGQEEAITAALTVDEVVWKVMKEKRDRKLAIEVGFGIFNIPNVRIIEVNDITVRNALELMQKNEHLHPRDAIHLAVALSKNVTTIASDDADFDKIKGIKRIKLD